MALLRMACRPNSSQCSCTFEDSGMESCEFWEFELNYIKGGLRSDHELGRREMF